MNPDKTISLVEETWNQSIIPNLCRYITIPCKSPAFDPNWETSGYLDQALELVQAWCLSQDIPGLTLSIERLPGRTPVLLIEIPGQIQQTILMYGHLDKQPEMEGWREDLSPWKPVIEHDRLYGRGGADDGYAVFSSLTAIKALQAQNIPHARCVILIETCEESGSYDLPFYLDHLEARLGEPNLVICLDSGCGNYDQFWCTTSLRGIVVGVLTVQILSEGVHSGAAGGIVPSSFRLLRQLLSRLEDEKTGLILTPELFVDIPHDRLLESEKVANALGEEVWSKYPWQQGAQPSSLSHNELILNNTWRPALAYTGVDGIPRLADAGNVLRPYTALKLSVRIPPGCDPQQAVISLQKILETDPPHGAKVTFECQQAASGWNAPKMDEWLVKALDSASETYFHKPVLYWGEGGTIPFMYMLGHKFPRTQFVITGVLGPHSNAHGPNEFLDIPMAKKLTCSIADVVAAHYKQFAELTQNLSSCNNS